VSPKIEIDMLLLQQVPSQVHDDLPVDEMPDSPCSTKRLVALTWISPFPLLLSRMGQSPPPQAQSESEYDPRSLYERLQANKDKKQEAFDEVHKLGNQFRGLDEGETQFLAEMQAERREEEMRKKQQQENELEEFRK